MYTLKANLQASALVMQNTKKKFLQSYLYGPNLCVLSSPIILETRVALKLGNFPRMIWATKYLLRNINFLNYLLAKLAPLLIVNVSLTS